MVNATYSADQGSDDSSTPNRKKTEFLELSAIKTFKCILAFVGIQTNAIEARRWKRVYFFVQRFQKSRFFQKTNA